MNPLLRRRSKVNGRFLQDYGGKSVSICGEIIKVNQKASTFEIKTTDNCVVNVVTCEPIDGSFEGWVEVRGVVQGKNVIIDAHVILLAADLFTDFDKQLYDEVMSIINACNNPWMMAD